MSDSEIQENLMVLDNLVDHQELKDELQSLDDFLGELQEEEEAAAPAKMPEPRQPRVHWRKRDVHGNIVYARPRSSRHQSKKADHIQNIDPPFNAPDTNCEVAFAPETVECFLQDLQHSLSDSSGDEASPLGTPRDPLLASSNWSIRQSLFSERWRAERPRLVNTAAAKESVATHICQQCRSSPAVIRCCDCRPRPFFCAECDISMHTRHVLHNRDAMTAGFFQPLPPTTVVVDKALSQCVRLVPVEMPEKICGCSPESLRVSPGKTVAVVTMNGRYDLSMPELFCEACQATWTAVVADLNGSDYWPATLQFATMYATDIFFSFEEMKMVAPGLSCQAFLRMLDQRTVRFGRTGKISADSFQKSFLSGRPSEEQAIFEGIFIAKDEDVTRFVDHIHSTTKHVGGRGVCGGEWSAARETSQRSASKVDEEGLELAVKWSGAYQDGAGLTLGEEVEQCNAFLSRIAVTTKHMSKAGRTDMLTLMAMRWNQQKFRNLEISLSRRYQKASHREPIGRLAATVTTTNDADGLASRIEVLVASIKRRSQRLYKDTDGNKGRARIRRKIREEKGILTSVVEKYNRMVPSTESLCMETILSDSVDLRTKRRAFDIIMSVRRLEEELKILVAEMDHHWKSLSTRADNLRELSRMFASETMRNSPCGLSEEGLKGLQSIILRKQHKVREMKVQARDCYLQVLSGEGNINFLYSASADEYDSDCEMSDDGL
ncbi:uncharacterized protein [Chanodichthys erythropterus]|uniref:uncharacterized protein n=1 Tax=Chanodichthys erythropterus TaxID=933992 RepID=UPI00351DBF81